MLPPNIMIQPDRIVLKFRHTVQEMEKFINVPYLHSLCPHHFHFTDCQEFDQVNGWYSILDFITHSPIEFFTELQHYSHYDCEISFKSLEIAIDFACQTRAQAVEVNNRLRDHIHKRRWRGSDRQSVTTVATKGFQKYLSRVERQWEEDHGAAEFVNLVVDQRTGQVRDKAGSTTYRSARSTRTGINNYAREDKHYPIPVARTELVFRSNHHIRKTCDIHSGADAVEFFKTIRDFVEPLLILHDIDYAAVGRLVNRRSAGRQPVPGSYFYDRDLRAGQIYCTAHNLRSADHVLWHFRHEMKTARQRRKHHVPLSNWQAYLLTVTPRKIAECVKEMTWEDAVGMTSAQMEAFSDYVKQVKAKRDQQLETIRKLTHRWTKEELIADQIKRERMRTGL